jgi:hypothetical protein
MDLWDVVQQVQIQNLKARQRSGESSTDWVADKSRARDLELDTKIARLLLVTEAMWELLSERSGVTVAELAERVRAIDARDGRLDGRHGVAEDAPQVRCPSCQAVVPIGKATCQFCGAAVPGIQADPFKL